MQGPFQLCQASRDRGWGGVGEAAGRPAGIHSTLHGTGGGSLVEEEGSKPSALFQRLAAMRASGQHVSIAASGTNAPLIIASRHCALVQYCCSPTSSSVTLAAFSVSHRQRMQMGLGRSGSGAHSHFSVGTGGSSAADAGGRRGRQVHAEPLKGCNAAADHRPSQRRLRPSLHMHSNGSFAARPWREREAGGGKGRRPPHAASLRAQSALLGTHLQAWPRASSHHPQAWPCNL